MHGDDHDHERNRGSSFVRLLVSRRALRVLLVLQVAVVALLFVLLLTGRGPAPGLSRSALAGSLPPGGATLPSMAIPGISPVLPANDALLGTTTMVVVTCGRCRSGDVVAGALQRTPADDVPDDSRVIVLVTDAEAPKWHLDGVLARKTTSLHAATTPSARQAVRERWPVDDSGVAFLYDRQGTWRSTFHLGQMQPDDMAHDLRALDRRRWP